MAGSARRATMKRGGKALQVEISARLLRVIRDLAEAQGRGESEVLEEAVVRYLQELGVEAEPDIGRPIGEIYAESPGDHPRDPFLALIDRMSSRFALDEDEAMRIAVEEQHAFRQESAEREGAER
jgi:hypothetical protein